MKEYVQKKMENEERNDEFTAFRQQFDKANVEEQLKTTVFGGYSKKKVQEIINTYKEMVSMMQESFDFQLKELTAERERVCNERAVLKKQLHDELEKNRETALKQQEYEELLAEHEGALKELSLAASQREEMRREYEKMARQYETLKEDREKQENLGRDDYEELLAGHQEALEKLKVSLQEQEQLKQEYDSLVCRYEELKKAGGGTLPEGESIKRMMMQLEEMTRYCEVMEEEQKNLEEQLHSMNTIGEELARMSEKYEKSRIELKDARRKYQRLQKENHSLDQEMASAGQVIAEIMEQYERKEEDNAKLRQQIKDYRQQLMTVKKEKLEHETAYVEMMEQTGRLEEDLQKAREEVENLQKELAELKRRNRDLESNKIIRIQTAAPDERRQESGLNGGISRSEEGTENSRQKMKELMERAEMVSRRITGDETEESGKEGAKNNEGKQDILMESEVL